MKPLTTAIDDDGVIELTVILGEQMGAVTFVQDYLQLHFDGPVLTLFVWPKVVVDASVFEVSTPGYRDRLCSVIGQNVTSARAFKNDRIKVEFSNGSSIVVPLGKQFRTTAEAAILKDGASERWEYW